MAEGFVLNISKEMLQRLDAADKKIVQIGESAEKAMKKINEAFGKKLTGVEDFIKQLNDIQQQLSKKDLKVNVDLALKNGALDSLKKQIEALGITIPVGVTATGTGGNTGGSVQNLQSLLDSIVKITTNLESMIKNFPKTTSTSNVSNKGENSIPKTNETLIESVKLWQTLQREVDKYNQELDKVNKEIKRVEEIRKNIASGKGGVYNPKEHQENINRAKDLQDLINKHQAEQKAIIEKNKALSETFNRQKELKNIGTQQQDIELLRLNEDLAKQEQQSLELEKQRTKELKEYEKLLIRIAQLKQEQDKVTKIQNTSTDSNVQAQAQQQQQRIQQLLTQANSRRVELENKLGNDVLQSQHKAGAKELEYLRKKEDEKLKEADRALKELMSKTKRWQQQQDRDQIAFYNTRQGALQYSQNAKTINEKIQAIKYLQNAQKSLDVTTSQGRSKFNELNREIKKTENELRRCGVQMNNFQEKSRHLFDITGQLGRALSLMFSVSQITQYVSKMVNVRKEMELQQRSLQVLLQNKDKANELWNQTLDLAVKSPFRVKELVTYTKQLAAYRIESEKLFETNKMLADVSAGLGVEMQRLILAFGQVKAASFLRGCLGKGTPIILYNEDIKEVQNIVVGDVIMGDDNTPRNVKEIIYGKEQMYIVKQGDWGDDYRVNENHILTLKDSITATIVDVYVKDYLKDKERYNGVKISKDGNIIDYPIELIKDNIDEYFGFVIDGNKRFLLGDGTITHNTELRQFTEAGIPMLEELAKYFGEIQGRAISVAEVFDMISKRMVTFTDVEKVFQRMTGAGGVFFNMQEELSQTTAGMISNFHDSVDLMFNEMGKKNQGLINNFIKAARYLVDNWETVGMVIKQVLQSLIFWKTTTFLINKDVDVYIKLLLQSKGILKTLLKDLKGGLADIMKSLKSGIKGGWISMAITGVIFLITKLIARQQEIKKEIEDTTKRYKEFADTVKDLNVEFSRLEGGNLEEYQEKLSTLVQLAERDYHIEVDFEVNNLKDIDEVKAKFSELEMQMMRMNNFALNFELSYTDLSHRGLSELWNEDINKDINQLSDSYSALYNNIRGDMNDLLYLLNHAEKPLNIAQKKIINALNPIGDTETERDYFKRLISVYPWIEYVYGDTYRALEDRIEELAPYRFNELYGFDIVTLRKLYEGYIDDLDEVEKESAKLFEKHSKEIANIITFEGLSGEQATTRAEELINYALKRLALEKEWNEYTLDEMRAFANEYFGDKYTGFNILPVIEPKEPFKGLKSWQQEYNKFIEDYSKTLKEAHDELDETDEIILGALPIAEDEQGYATTQRKKLKEIKELLEDERELLKQATDENGKVIASFAESFDLEASKTKISLLEMLWKWLGGEEDDKSKGNRGNIIKDQINLIKQLYEEYQKLSKEMSATKARSKVRSGFADAADEYGLNIAGIDFTNLQGVLEALQTLVPQAQAAGKDAMQELSKSIGETEVELELLAYVKAREDFDDKINDMFSDYEISLELDKLNIPKNLASQLFGVDTVDLDEIKTALQNKLNDLDSADISLTQQLQDKDIDDTLRQSLLLQQKGNKQLREQTEANLRKISDMEQKELEERLKTYTKYLLNEQHERVKIRMETLRMLQEVEDTEEYTPAQRQTITDKIKEEERKKLAQQTWKDFEQSPMYMQMFDDVENMGKGALESLITQMGTLKDDLQSMGLPASDLKEILGAINKAEEELERRNPFKNFAKNAKIAFTNTKRLKELEEQRAREQEAYDTAKTNYDNIQSNLAEQTQVLDTLEKGTIEYNAQLALLDLIQKATNYWSKEVEDSESNLNETNKKINDINDSSNDFYDQLKNIGSITQSVVDGIFQITDAMSWLPEETQLTIDRLQSLSNNVFGIAGGIGSIMSGDIIGGITQIIGSLSGLIATFVEWSSGTKEATIQIERQGRILSNLQNKYDRLNEALNEAWDIRQIKEYNAELKKNLQQQIIAQKAIIAAQESIKGSDKYGSEQWLELQEAQDELQNLYDMQQELQDNIYEKITGGIIDNTIDAISSWVDAWYDAFKETGDGLKGLEDNFNEMLLNLVKRQAVMKVAGRFIDQWNSVLERYVNDDDNLSLGEITSWANMIEQDLPALSSQLKTFFKAFDGILGDTQGNLSGLQRGVTEIQESTAKELASYLNSIRFIVSDSNAQLKLLVSAQTGATSRSENTMVEQLKVIAQQTSAINTLLGSLVKGGHSLGGVGLKVFI